MDHHQMLRTPPYRAVKLALIFLCGFLLASLQSAAPAVSQPLSTDELKKLVQAFKNDPRGPYQAIRWFCPDGTVRPANTPCPEPGGLQHALPKDMVQAIAKKNGIYLGQILAGASLDEVLDLSNQSSRIKQYQMEKFLQAADDGWILRRARYYRGAVQAENEDTWGMKFLTWLLAQDDRLTSQFFLCRQISQDIPHQANDNQLRSIRTLAKTISDSVASFSDLRIKIHGQPDAQDLDRVRMFRFGNREKISPDVEKLFLELEAALVSVYQTPDPQMLERYIRTLPANAPVTGPLKTFIQHRERLDTRTACRHLTDLLWDIRRALPQTHPGRIRLVMMDLSMDLERMLFRTIRTWEPVTIGELLDKAYVLAKAAAGCGFLEVWEWEALEPAMAPKDGDGVLPLEEFIQKVEVARRAVNWGTGMVRVVYDPVVDRFAPFEPLASGFIDDRIRSSVLLAFGEVTGELADQSARHSGVSNRMLGPKDQSQIHGLNPGFAVGELEVVTGPPEKVAFSPKKIYMLLRAPADMKPVAGIATVTEGNTVSHVQLLARNLGIPNAILSSQALNELAPFSGARVFYAVSPRGTVVIKPDSDMTPEEKALVEVRKRKEERIRVPTDRMDLSYTDLPHLIEVRASDSGRICGPKAANLGQLRALFPDHVAPGLVIPFGVFRQHMDQQIPGQNTSFWQFLQETFAQAGRQRAQGMEEESEQAVLHRLTELRGFIREMAFRPEFLSMLQRAFPSVFGADLGQILVFIRSDTNMEDLKDFTGAGLNLTVPNVLRKDDILQAIREVWASPFTERSYQWRQKYLLNPENVYPSILLLQSVNVEKSGVMITTGVASSDSRDVTVAFNRGVGGAVEGQATESYLLRYDGTDLLWSPAREPKFTYLPIEGGVRKGYATLDQPILSPSERAALRQQAEEIRRCLPGTPGIESNGPFDVELGFLDGKIWLFQVRPFVESKWARSSAYLNTMDPELPTQVKIRLDEELNPEG